ncbi:MAG: metal-dependent transcriptional regulator [Bacteroidia bacterium]|nr:metal-dependent transcriptional regulator [Bacteroidia bacterium]MBP9689180.1 metal-dependent transcriptional regulator [Bacteroidia bacterium]
MYSYTEENYLKTIYKLSTQDIDAVSTNAIAEVLQTKAASVTDMLKKLADKNLVNYAKYKGVDLTDKGRKVALDTVRKHRLWECFLYDKLHFGWDEVHEIAEQLEHINSEALTDKLDEFLEFPTHDPHGDPIPTKNGVVKKSNFILLSEAKLNQNIVMTGVADHSAAFLQHLNKIGLVLGTALIIVDKSDYDGSITVNLSDNNTLHFSKDVTKNVWVKVK